MPVRALASIHSYMYFSLDVRSDDVYWNVADPGWAYGCWYGLIGPLLLGQTILLRGKRFDVAEVLDTLTRHRVTNLAAAPTVYRALRAGGVPSAFAEQSSLRAVSSAGEPLNAELLTWSRRYLGVPIHDHYGQSEIRMVVGHHHHPSVHGPLVPGSMGIPSPGYRVVVVNDRGEEVGCGIDGELALDTQRSSLYWFRGYYKQPERTAERFRHGPRYYLTGDTARGEDDGHLRFISRADDVINSSGYRVGPVEVENALMAHSAVAEVAVVGTPDELRGEVLNAFVVTTVGVASDAGLAEELQTLVRRDSRRTCTRAELCSYPNFLALLLGRFSGASCAVVGPHLRRVREIALRPAGRTAHQDVAVPSAAEHVTRWMSTAWRLESRRLTP